MFERATRLCRISPQITTISPAISPPVPRVLRAERMVSASSRPCVGCSCWPSPALSTGQSTLSAISCTAPLDWCRMTIASACIAFNVIAVSISVSPFLTELCATCILTTSAPSRLPASSNESSVRVLFSKKALMIVSPAKRSSRLCAERPKVTHCSASSIRNRSSHGASSARPVRSRCGKAAEPAG